MGIGREIEGDFVCCVKRLKCALEAFTRFDGVSCLWVVRKLARISQQGKPDGRETKYVRDEEVFELPMVIVRQLIDLIT